MDAKLTLKLNKDLKHYAKSQGTSVSRLLENYAKKIIIKQENVAEKPIESWLEEIKAIREKYPPVTASDEELQADYNAYRDKKYGE